MFTHEAKRRLFWRWAHRYSVLLLRRRIIALSCVACAAVGFIYALVTRPVFSSRATVRVEGLGTNGVITNEVLDVQ